MRWSVRVAGVVAMASTAVACGRGSSGQGRAADSTAASVVPVDTISAMPGDPAVTPQDSTATVAPVRPATKAPAKVPAARTTSTQPYDSAFGPSFTVDSTGKITPIRKKKP